MKKTFLFYYFLLCTGLGTLCPSAFAGIGDVNGSEDIDLGDAISSLQVCAGVTPFSEIDSSADVDGNGKICADEAIYALQVLSGLRSWPPPLLKGAKYPIGVAIAVDKLHTHPYQDRVVSHFDSVTPENAMKMHRVFLGENTWSFSDVDQIMDFCRTSGMKLHAHNAVWPEHVPTWVADWVSTRDKTALKEQIYKTHIEKMMTRYSDAFVTGWDIANDFFDKNGTILPLKINGEDTVVIDRYGLNLQFDLNDIADFFRWAHAANPEARLFLNESFCAHWRVYKPSVHPKYEFLEQKANKVLEMIDQFQLDGVPIHGIGIQMHISFNQNEPDFELLRNFIQGIYSRGLSVRFSEVDVSMNTAPDINNYQKGSDPTAEMKAKQKQRVCSMAALYESIPENYRSGITFWGLSDADCWISRDQEQDYYRVDWPVLFDRNYNPKPAFFGFADGLDGYCTMPDVLYLQNEIIETSENYSAVNTIRAGKAVTDTKPYGDFVLEATADVTIQAGIISLESGFEAKIGSHVEILSQ